MCTIHQFGLYPGQHSVTDVQDEPDDDREGEGDVEHHRNRKDGRLKSMAGPPDTAPWLQI